LATTFINPSPANLIGKGIEGGTVSFVGLGPIIKNVTGIIHLSNPPSACSPIINQKEIVGKITLVMKGKTKSFLI
jgi:hypothetical protein